MRTINYQERSGGFVSRAQRNDRQKRSAARDEQCRMLQSSRSGSYYTSVPLSDRDRELMRIIDGIHVRTLMRRMRIERRST